MPASITKIDNNKHFGENPGKSKYKIEIIRDLCIGAASCVAIAADTFQMDEENLVYMVDSEWDEDDMILAAAQSCPVFAIIVKDAETGEQLFPEV